MRLTADELQQATRGTWRYGLPDAITGISTDTRNFKRNDVFLALRGTNFDGHHFANSIIVDAKALIGDTNGINVWDAIDLPQLEVADTQVALGDIAHAWRQQLTRTTVIAITGSYGKTSVRSMLHHVFSSLGLHVSATAGNLNNLIGTPLTLLGVPESADIALIECGISEPGEMQRLSEIVAPDVAVITGFAAAHGEGLGGLRGVVREKSRILDHLLPQGWCAFGKHVLKPLLQECDMPHSYLSMDQSEHAVQYRLEGCQLHLQFHGENHALQLPLPALHWAENMALVASIVIRQMQVMNQPVSLAEIATALQGWTAPPGRMHQRQGIQHCIVLDDSYNANPASMQAALNTLAQMPGHRIAILGDMAELGEASAELHGSLQLTGIDEIALVGPMMHNLHTKHPQSRWFASTEEASHWLEIRKQTLGSKDTLLIKGSRSMQLDRLVRQLAKEEALHAV